ncbi:MAG: type III-B CRISPR module RAMP protein Cmr4 [Thiotrichales bacterium]
MNAWEEAKLTGLYTLSHLHVGGGQSNGAVDLPIQRDVVTNLPIIPPSAIKGVAREAFEMASKSVKRSLDDNLIGRLFGKSLDRKDGNKSRSADEDDKPSSEEGDKPDSKADLSAGTICFSEARLIAYPARALNRPFLYITSPSVLKRLARDARVFNVDLELKVPNNPDDEKSADQNNKVRNQSWALVSSANLANQPLVIEDLVVAAERVVYREDVLNLAQTLANSLLPPVASEPETVADFIERLVILRDIDFHELIERIVPVRARTKLTEGKTTDRWRDDEGKVQTGNLWYEEYLPSDCVFAGFLGSRRGSPRRNGHTPMEEFVDHLRLLSLIQIGGNETVGHGICHWRIPDDKKKGGGS